ncbi:MAG: N-acetylneuraminate synthase [Candidatus Omnitrophica bacterium]|nr:N-acetylneuraminate synthase [Candidatus Omnitrophota bacterium]
MVKPVEIAGRWVGPGEPCFIVAEVGVNHNRDLDMARRLVDAAKSAGADAVKFQAFKAERLAAACAPKAHYQAETTGGGESQLEMLRRLEFSQEANRTISAYCRQQGIWYMCTPFDEESADFLETLDVAVFKVPSGEVTNLPYLRHIAQKGRPMIVSTGMSTEAEVAEAVRVIREAGNPPLILLHCVSNYPADPADANLRAMASLTRAFGVPVGYSDHTPGIEVALAAVALGACVIEKHVTLNRNLPGPDHQMSLEPDELAALVRGIRLVERALGHGRKEPAARELETAAVARKSLVAACDVRAGTRLTEALITTKRPGIGLPPSLLPQVIGRIAAQDIPADALIALEMLR